MAEPNLHVRRKAFEAEVALAKDAGFEEAERPRIPRTHAVVMRRSEARSCD
jgi:hypothetical protein